MITTSPLVKTYTLQEFWDLPEPQDRSKLELIKVVLYMSPPSGEFHDDIAAIIIDLLIAAVRENEYRGKIFIPRAPLWTDNDTYLEPDLMYVSDELKAQMGHERRTRADIVIEILSPSTANYDRTTKSDTYRAVGVREMWIVDAEAKAIEVRSFEAGKTAVYKTGDVLRSNVLPKIGIPITALFSQRE